MYNRAPQLTIKSPVQVHYSTLIRAREQNIQNKILQGESLLLSDFVINCRLQYTYKNYNFGESDNILFCIENFQSVLGKRLNFQLSTVLDNKGNNLLHYAVFRHDHQLVSAIIRKSRIDGSVNRMVNHRNTEGTNPLGLIFSMPINVSNLQAQLIIVNTFVLTSEYKINAYLNNKIFLDYAVWRNNSPMSREKVIGGTNLLHNFILLTSELTYDVMCRHETLVDNFFSNLISRLNKLRDTDFNPHYPTIHPDLQRMTTGDLIKQPFKFQGVQSYIATHLNTIFDIYKAMQLNDDSGDSDVEETHACEYKKLYKQFHRVIEASFKNNLDIISSLEKIRIFERFNKPYVKVPRNFLIGNRFKNFSAKINLPVDTAGDDYDRESFREILDSIVVPLFHGVPFMDSQYTNHQRRKIFKIIKDINTKLLAEFNHTDDKRNVLNNNEKIRVGIHSRTAMASAGVQSLYELTSADKNTLDRLKATDDKLFKFFKKNNTLKNLRSSLYQYILNFKNNNAVKNFWDTYKDSLPQNIIKHRFPTISTSKAPDHAIRFATGRNVAFLTGDSLPMRPQYHRGYPTHRVAGLLYVTLHKLSDLVQQRVDRTMIDVNQSFKKGEIKNDTSSIKDDIMYQNECTFFGKFDSDSVIAVIPIVYPHEQSIYKLDHAYHQDIYGLKVNKRSIFDQSRVGIFDKPEENPSIVDRSDNYQSSFAATMMPSMVNLANGLAAAYANNKNLLLHTIDDTNKLKPYPVNFDNSKGFSKAHYYSRNPSDVNQNIVVDRLWEHILRGQPKSKQAPARTPARTSRINIDNRSIVVEPQMAVPGVRPQTIDNDPFRQYRDYYNYQIINSRLNDRNNNNGSFVVPSPHVSRSNQVQNTVISINDPEDEVEHRTNHCIRNICIILILVLIIYFFFFKQ